MIQWLDGQQPDTLTLAAAMFGHYQYAAVNEKYML